MPMNEILIRMNALKEGLEKFNNNLVASFNDLNENHEVVSPLWQDDMRNEYDSRWLSLEEAMEDYINKIGPNYVETLSERINEIRRYLHGN